MSAHSTHQDPDLEKFLPSISTDRLCAAASVLRKGVKCSIGQTIVGGYNVLFEIVFEDDVKWFARFPLPYNCSSQDASDKLMHSCAASLKYIKLHTTIPVPAVLACRSGSDQDNDVGASYMLIERLPGHPLELRDIYKNEKEHESTRASAEKVHQQLAGFVMQLASLQFHKIGSIQEQPIGRGTFTVGEYFNAGILFPPERGQIYEVSSSKGPFDTVSEYHTAILNLNENFAAVDPEDEDGEYMRSVQQCRLIQHKISLPKYENGPFVLNHDDLSSSNILVDEEYNITGILDFPGTVVPLPALCVYPIIVTENYDSPFTDRKLWLQCLLSAQPVPGSALNDLDVRKRLMESAHDRGSFDMALTHTYAYVAVASLADALDIMN